MKNPIKVVMDRIKRMFSFTRFLFLWGVIHTIATLYFIYNKDAHAIIFLYNAIIGYTGALVIRYDDRKQSQQSRIHL